MCKKIVNVLTFCFTGQSAKSQSSSITSGVKVSTDIDVFGVFNIHVYFWIQQSSFIYHDLELGVVL